MRGAVKAHAFAHIVTQIIVFKSLAHGQNQGDDLGANDYENEDLRKSKKVNLGARRSYGKTRHDKGKSQGVMSFSFH